MHVCIYVLMYVCTYVCMYACMYVCMYVCTYVCTYVCMYACMYVCMCVCILNMLWTDKASPSIKYFDRRQMPCSCSWFLHGPASACVQSASGSRGGAVDFLIVIATAGRGVEVEPWYHLIGRYRDPPPASVGGGMLVISHPNQGTGRRCGSATRPILWRGWSAYVPLGTGKRWRGQTEEWSRGTWQIMAATGRKDRWFGTQGNKLIYLILQRHDFPIHEYVEHKIWPVY
jgi:hypothetical protein